MLVLGAILGLLFLIAWKCQRSTTVQKGFRRRSARFAHCLTQLKVGVTGKTGTGTTESKKHLATRTAPGLGWEPPDFYTNKKTLHRNA